VDVVQFNGDLEVMWWYTVGAATVVMRGFCGSKESHAITMIGPKPDVKVCFGAIISVGIALVGWKM